MFNLGSTKQLQQQVYGVEGLKVRKHRKTHKPTFDADTVAELRASFLPFDPDYEEREGLTLPYIEQRIAEGAHPLLEARVLYAQAQQTRSHYILPLFEVTGRGKKRTVGQIRERIYPQIKQHAQATGRWSITGPPLQQLPRDLLDILLPDPGEVWFTWDHDQVEYRLLADLADDRVAREAFARGDDIHTLNTQAIFGACNGKDDARRDFTKRFVYRLHYRGKPEEAGDIPGARQLRLGKAQLVKASRDYLALHPAIPIFWRTQDEEILRTGESRTFMGRRRRGTRPITGKGLRELANHPLQGGVRDIMNLNLLAIKTQAPWTRLVFERHDAAYMACPEEQAEGTRTIIESILGQEWLVNEHATRYPATVKVIHGNP